MSLCEYCEKGQLEMCAYFKEHFLESGTAVRSCPAFEPETDGEMEVLKGSVNEGKVRILTSRCIRKAMAGERVMLLTAYKAAQAGTLLETIAASELKNSIASVCIDFHNGGEIVIGGLSNGDQ